MIQDPELIRNRRELCLRAAALIADQGYGFHQAKQHAASELFGRTIPKDVMPNTLDLEAALLEHLELFDPEEHHNRKQSLQAAALSLMTLLEEFSPYVTGAAWKGIVSEHAHGHLQIFCDDAKLVTLAIINRGLEIESTEVAHFAQRNSFVEALAIEWQTWPFQISLYDSDDLRGALKPNANGQAERGSLKQFTERVRASK